MTDEQWVHVLAANDETGRMERDFRQGHPSQELRLRLSQRAEKLPVNSRIVGNPEVILGPQFVRWSGCQRLYIPSDYRKLTHHFSDET
jgi:hypothetical protein